MPLALVIYALFLLIEGGLAWLVSGNPFLLAAVTCGVLFYAAVWKQAGPWGEVVRALAAGLIAVAGPLYYKAALLPTLLCFLALPHLLATTQCFWEIALGKDPAAQNAKMRTVVFTVAFYAAMGLVFVLLRGAEAVSAWITAPLAVLVLVLAIPAWDQARVTRLKPGRAPRAVPFGIKARRIVLVAAVLGAIAAFFSGVLPAAAEKLCAISPRWRIKADAPEQRPPHEDKPAPAPQDNGAAQRPGLDTSAITGRHELPPQADIKATGETMLYLRPHSRAKALQMAHGQVYVRSHTLDEWKDGAWSASVRGGAWLDDDTDGQTDGVITLRAPSAADIPHTIFLENADGYSLPALQNAGALHFPRVYALHGDIHQMQTSGDIRYDAVSAPLLWDALPDRDQLRAGPTDNVAQTKPADSRLMMDLIYGDALLNGDKAKTLPLQIVAVQAWLSQNTRYSTVMKGNPAMTPLDNFLIGERQGYCDFYATAAALMLRFYGVPTRVAYGYAGRQFDEAGGVFIFTDASAHAWTEVFVAGHGWTVCDFTPPANIGNLDGQKDTPPPPFDEKAFAAQKEKKPEPPPQKPPEEFSLSQWWNDTMTKLAAMDSMERTKQVLTWIAAAAVLFFLLRMLRKKQRADADAADPFAADERQPAYYAEFIRVFQEAGLPRRQGSTPREYLDTVRRRGMVRGEFDPMISYHYARRYADAERDRAREDEYLAAARAAEARLREARQN